MSNPLRIFVLAGGAEWEVPLLTCLELSSSLTLVRRCIDVADLLAASATDHADIALVDPSIRGLDLDVVDRLTADGLTIWAVGGDGARLGLEFQISGEEVTLIEQRLLDSRAHMSTQYGHPDDVGPARDTADVRGSVTAIWGPTGSPGRSTMALALAACHGRSGESTLLVDADTRSAALAQMLAILDDVSGVMATCRDVNLGRNRRIDEHLLRVLPNLDVLTGIPRPDLWHHVKPNSFSRVLAQARETHQQIVVDCGMEFSFEDALVPAVGDLASRVLAEADLMILVARPDPISIARMLRASQETAELVNERAFVVNGMRSSTPWGEQQIADMIFHVTGERPIAFLPFDAEVCDRALLKGEPVTEIAPDSALAVKLTELADMIRSTVEPLATTS